jgi:hypothetical protein
VSRSAIRRTTLLGVAQVALATASCSPPRTSSLVMPTPSSSAVPAPSDAQGRELAGHPGLSVRLLSRRRIPYDPNMLGAGGTSLGVELTNTSNAEIPVESLHAFLSPTREGVPFPCVADISAGGGIREPKSLRPGEAFTFHREIDCRLTMPGTYDVAVKVEVGPAKPVDAGRFSFELEARGPRVPRPHPAVPGLFAIVTGDNASRPQGSAAAPGYAVVIGIVNAGPRAIGLPGARVLFRVTRVGTSLPCMDEPVVVHSPSKLDPGQTFVERVPITCVMNKPGTYDIDSALLVGDDGREGPLGRVRLTVSNDPLLFTNPRAY